VIEQFPGIVFYPEILQPSGIVTRKLKMSKYCNPVILQPQGNDTSKFEEEKKLE